MDKNSDQMTDKDIREEVDTFLFEGHDTSSIAIIMTIILLGLHQNVQVKIIINNLYFLIITYTTENKFISFRIQLEKN